VNQKDNLQNPMQAAIKTFNIIEGVLKEAHRKGTPLTMARIKAHPDVVAAGIIGNKVRDVVEMYVRKELVLSEGERMNRTYQWFDLEHTYVPTKNQLNASNGRPGKVEDVMKDNVVTQERAPKAHKAIELVVSGVTIVIDKNPATGRPRIIIEG
jgi:hypothetical protein